MGCPKLTNRSQPLMGRSSPYCEDMWGRVGRRSRQTFSTDFEIFRRRCNLFSQFRLQIFRRRVGIFSHFFYVVFILSSKVMLIFLLYNNSSVVAEMGDRLATIDMGQTEGGAVPLSRGAGSPFNTMSSGPRPTSTPSSIFIHPAVWPQQTWAKNWGL